MSLVITRAIGFVTVQDLGRPGRMHEGLPRGGALVPELLVRANRAVGNPDGAAAIEVCGRLVVRATAPIEVAGEAGPRTLHLEEELAVTSEPRRAAYLAMRGGVEAPLVLGSRSTHLTAGIGSLLRAGVRVESARMERVAGGKNRAGFDDGGPIRLIAGPDRDAFASDALEVLVAADYRILPTSDRVGTRLEGAPLVRTDVAEVSRPMVRGAIEVPRDGQPIVLGPEHPTTGGYPVIAVIACEDLDRFFAIRLGGSVRFTAA